MDRQGPKDSQGNIIRVGDKVRRISGSHSGMNPGDVGTVSRVTRSCVSIIEYQIGLHMASNLLVVIDKSNPSLVETAQTRTREVKLWDKDGVAIIECGCHEGTIRESLDLARQKGRDDYEAAVNYLKVVAENNDLALERQEEKYALELTRSELNALLAIMGSVSGSPTDSPRKHSDSAYYKLVRISEENGFCHEHDKFLDLLDGSLSFRDHDS